jgi:hypothetical protein
MSSIIAQIAYSSKCATPLYTRCGEQLRCLCLLRPGKVEDADFEEHKGDRALERACRQTECRSSS